MRVFNLHERWEGIALVMGSCQQNEGTRGELALGKVAGTMLPRRFPQELGMDQPLLPLGANKSMEQRRGKGLNPTRRVSAQHSPADPH